MMNMHENFCEIIARGLSSYIGTADLRCYIRDREALVRRIFDDYYEFLGGTNNQIAQIRSERIADIMISCNAFGNLKNNE